MKVKITQLWKNDKWTGLWNILSYMYSKKDPAETVQIFFDTKEWEKSLTLGWKIKKNSEGKVTKWYSYLIPKDITKDNREKEFFSTTQDLFLPAITSTLYEMGYSDPTLKGVITDKRDNLSIDNLFDTSLNSENDEFDKFNISEDSRQLSFNFDDYDNEEEKMKKYKLGTIEILHQIFNKNNNLPVIFPKDIKYERISEAKVENHHPDIKQIHVFKQLMWDMIVDSPLEELFDLTISGSTFNVTARWNQPLVIELQSGEKIASKQIRTKVLVQEGHVKIPYLYAKLTEENYKYLSWSVNNLITDKVYDNQKFYKIPLDGVAPKSHMSWNWNIFDFNSDDNISNSENKEVSLVNKKLLTISQEEFVNLVYDIEVLKARQTVHNSRKKILTELKDNLTYITWEDSWSIDSLHYKELWISWGIYNPVSKDTPEIENSFSKEVVIKKNISIDVVKFPKTAKEKEEAYILAYMLANEIAQITKWISITKDLDISKLEEIISIWYKNVNIVKLLLEKVEANLKKIKSSIKDKTYKLSLLSNAFFLNWFSPLLNYSSSEETPTKAKGVVNNVKQTKTFTSNNGEKVIRVQLWKTSETI